MQYRVGVYSDSYPDKRMILDKIPECEYVQIENRGEIIGRGLRYLGRYIKPLEQKEFYAQGVHFTLDTSYHPELDIIHTFNRVCLGDKNRWVATFEKTFPEYFSDETHLPMKMMERYLPLLLSEKCIALLPMSKWAHQYELWLLNQVAKADELRAIEEKIETLYPPQELLSSSEEIYHKYETAGKIKFFYVGSQLKRKGGVELIRVLDRLHREYKEFTAVVVGDIENEYCNFRLDEEEKEKIIRIISEADWLEYHRRMTNEEILRCANEAHVGILPTMGDTFGFSVLEMQACGCPVITTDRQTMPEINNAECGWLLDTREAKNTHGDDFAHYTKNEVAVLSEIIQIQLEHVLRDILDHPELIQDKAIHAFDRVSREHDPQQYASKLLSIYRRQDYN